MLKLVAFAFAAFGSLAAAAPSGSEPEGNVSFLSRTKQEGLEMVLWRFHNPPITRLIVQIQTKVNLRSRAAAGELDERQIPSFGRYCVDWDYQGNCYYHRANIDGKGYYIGDDVRSILSLKQTHVSGLTNLDQSGMTASQVSRTTTAISSALT